MRTRRLVLVSIGVELEGNEKEAGLQSSSRTKWLNLLKACNCSVTSLKFQDMDAQNVWINGS